ncbi:MAG TPA: hypothetical protein VK835_06580, partial [Bacteroidia bacterium]|nr:hypothetical protein [Bacteroidia bacterium]
MNKKIFATVLIVLLSWTIKSQNNTQKEYLKMREANRASLVPKTKILNDCNFFGGDTLSGFPIETEVDALLLKYKNCDYNELKTTIKNKEVTFIKNKYKIEKLPFELAEEKYNKTHQIQYNNPNKPTNNSKGANPSPFASACGNLDFENGDFSNWIGYEGHNTNSNAALNLGGGTGPITPPPNLNSVETSCDYFAILNAGFGSDPLSGTTVPSPLGGNCARLGGENRNLGTTGPPIDCDPTPSNSSNYTAGEVLETTFTVTPANTAFQYAFVFVYADDGFHVNGAQPYFRIEVLDHLGANITCLSYYQQGNNGVAPVGYSSNGSVFYNSNWKISSLNLKPYLNQAVTIRFTVCGCTQQAHFGYAYVDCKCAPLELIIPNAVCQGQSATLTAPPQSDGTYAWTGSGAITSATTNSIITTSTAGTYTVKITNQQGCSYTLDTTIA